MAVRQVGLRWLTKTMSNSTPRPWTTGYNSPEDPHKLKNPAFQALVLPEERREIETFAPGVLVYSREYGNLYLHDGVHPGGLLLTECGSGGSGNCPFRVFELEDPPVEDYLVPGDVWLQPAVPDSSGADDANFKQYEENGDSRRYILRFWTGSRWLRPRDVADLTTDTDSIKPPRLVDIERPDGYILTTEPVTYTANPDIDELRAPQITWISVPKRNLRVETPYGDAVVSHVPLYNWDPAEWGVSDEEAGIETPEVVSWEPGFFEVNIIPARWTTPPDDSKHEVRSPAVIVNLERDPQTREAHWVPGRSYEMAALVSHNGITWQAGPYGVLSGIEPAEDTWWWNSTLFSIEYLENFDPDARGPWYPDRIYAPGQEVEHDGSVWRADPNNGASEGYEPSDDSPVWEWVEYLDDE